MRKKLLGAAIALLLVLNGGIAVSNLSAEAATWKECGCDLGGGAWCTDLVYDACSDNQECEDDCF